LYKKKKNLKNTTGFTHLDQGLTTHHLTHPLEESKRKREIENFILAACVTMAAREL